MYFTHIYVIDYIGKNIKNITIQIYIKLANINTVENTIKLLLISLINLCV